MSCTIKKDFQYNRVMPTFHHWKTGNLKYGKMTNPAQHQIKVKAALFQLIGRL